MVDKCMNEIKTELVRFLDGEQLEGAVAAISVILSRYTISEGEKALSVINDRFPPFYQAFFVSKKIEGRSMATLNQYRMVLKKFFFDMARPVEKITQNDVRCWLYMTAQETGVSNRTMDTKRAVLMSFFSWAVTEGYMEKNPVANVKKIKYQKVERKPLSDVELEMVRTACGSVREKALVETLYSTGCRVSEISGLDIEDIDFAEGTAKVTGKGNKRRTVFVNARATLAIRQYIGSRISGPVFTGTKEPHDRLQKSGIEKVVGEIGERSGIGRKLHPHLLRHTFATDCLTRGMAITGIQKVLGHSSINTTMVYARADMNDVHEAFTKCIV